MPDYNAHNRYILIPRKPSVVKIGASQSPLPVHTRGVRRVSPASHPASRASASPHRLLPRMLHPRPARSRPPRSASRPPIPGPSPRRPSPIRRPISHHSHPGNRTHRRRSPPQHRPSREPRRLPSRLQDKVQIDPTEEGIYTPDATRQIFQAGPLTFGIAICHEGWRYPETVRWAARRGSPHRVSPQLLRSRPDLPCPRPHFPRKRHPLPRRRKHHLLPRA